MTAVTDENASRRLDFTSILPEELALNIFNLLTHKELAVASRVSTEWKRLANDPDVWRQKVEETFPQQLHKMRTINGSELPFKVCDVGPRGETTLNYKRLYKYRTIVERRWRKGKSSASKLLGDSEVVFCVKLVDDQHLISAGSSIRFWNIQKESADLILENDSSGILAMDYNKKTKKLAVGSFNGNVRVYDTNMNPQETLASMKIKDLKELLRSKNLPYEDCLERGDLIRRIETMRALPMASLSRSFLAEGVVVGMELHEDLLVASGHDCKIRLWNIQDNTYNTDDVADRDKPIQILRGHLESVSCVKMFDQKTKLISCSNDTSLRIWDVPTGKPTQTLFGHNGWIWGLQHHEPTDQAITSSVDHTVALWDLRAGNVTARLKEHNQAVAGVRADFTDSHRLVSSSFDRTIKLWDLRNLNHSVATFCGHTERCTRVDFDSNRIASASFDGTVRLWNFDY